VSHSFKQYTYIVYCISELLIEIPLLLLEIVLKWCSYTVVIVTVSGYVPSCH